MKSDFIDAFRENFESLEKEINILKSKIKEDASKDVSALIAANRFAESKKAVEFLEQLLEEISFDFTFSKIEVAFDNYMDKFNVLKNQGANNATQDKGLIQTKEVEAEQAFQVTQEYEKSAEKSSFTSFVSNKFSQKGFQVVQVDNQDIEIANEKRKHFHLTINSPEMTKEDYFDILDRKNDKKNIGFICQDEKELSEVKSIVKEWALKNPNNTSFVFVNLTTKSKLDSPNKEVFETISL